MRKFALYLPILALTACSAFEQPYLQDGNIGDFGNYNQGCVAAACALGQSYSVAESPDSYHFAGGAADSYWPDTQLVPHYESGGPVSINPAGFGHYGQSGYAGQTGLGYGQPPYLRGLRGQKKGSLYGTLGGVMYDTDVESFGVQGRLGWDSGRALFWGGPVGVEVEGSIGLTDESLEDLSAFSDRTTGYSHNIGVYAVERIPLTSRLSLLGRIGYNSQKRTDKETVIADNTEVNGSVTFKGMVYGIGAEYAVSPNTGLRLDYTALDSSLSRRNSFAASVVKKF